MSKGRDGADSMTKSTSECLDRLSLCAGSHADRNDKPAPINGHVSRRAPMTNREKDVIRALACVMWVDGHAASSERGFVEELIAVYDATDAEKGELIASLDSDCAALYQTELEGLTREEKELLLSNAAVLTHVDDVQLPSEKAILGKFGRMLGLPEEVVARILSEAAEDRAVSLPSRALEELFGT